MKRIKWRERTHGKGCPEVKKREEREGEQKEQEEKESAKPFFFPLSEQ